MSRSYELAFKLQGYVDKSFKGSITSASKSLNGLNKKISEIESSRKQITRFTALKKEIQSTEYKFFDAQSASARLAKEIAGIEKPTKKLQREFANANKKAKQLKTTLLKKRNTLASLRREMGQAGVNTRKLASENQRLATSYDKARNAQTRLQKTILRGQQIKNKRAERRGQLMGAAAIGAGLYGIVKAHSNVAAAQGEIASLGISEKGIESITKAGIKFSNTWKGTTAPAFITASYDIKSGIASLGDVAVGEFTRIAALTGKATKATTQDMTSMFATGYGIYRKQFETFGASTISGWQDLSDEEKDIKFGEYFSAGIASTVKQFKTDGPKMSAAFSALGATATKAGYSYADQLTIIGELSQTMSGSEAATKLEAFISNAVTAAEKLDLDFVNEETGKLLKLPDILDLLKDKYDGVIDEFAKNEIKDAFGRKEAKKLIELLIDDTDGLRKSAILMNESLQGGMATTLEMAKKMERGPGVVFSRLIQISTNLAAKLGGHLAPAASKVANIASGLAVKAMDFADRFPFVTKVVVILGSSIAALTVSTIALGYAWTFVSGGWNSAVKLFQLLGINLNWATVKTIALSIAQKAAAAGMWLVTAAQYALNLAMTLNPIGLIIAGIAALVALGVLLYHKWQPFKELVQKLWAKFSWVIYLFPPLWGLIALGKLIYAHWEPIKDFIVNLWNKFGKVAILFTPLGILIKMGKMFIRHWGPVKAFLDKLWTRLKKMWDLFCKIKKYIPGFGGKKNDTVQKTAAIGMKAPGKLPYKPGNVIKFPENKIKFSEVEKSALSNTNLNFKPTIHINGSGMNPDQVKQAADQSLIESEERMKKIMDQMNEDERRRSFG